MVVVVAILVTVSVSVAIRTAILDIRMKGKERDNIKTEEDLKEFERKMFFQGSGNLPFMFGIGQHVPSFLIEKS